MNESNPYQAAPGSGELPPVGPVRQVKIKPFALLSRTHQFMGDQYMLMVGITFVTMLVGSMVPFGLIMGAMMVGLYLCFMQIERYGRTEFGTAFKGFDQFMDSFLVILISMAIAFAVMIPIMIVFGVLFFALAVGAQGGGGGEAAGPVMVLGVIVFYLVIILVSIFVYLPVLFALQLVADRRCEAWPAVKLSWQGVKANFMGVAFHLMVCMICGFACAMMCYIPVFFFAPISIGSFFLLYRDIFGPGTVIVPPPTGGLPVQQPPAAM